jgi:hypothetical protein
VVVLILVSALIVSATQAVFYVEGRHRLAIDPLILIMSGAGLTVLGQRLWATVRAGRGLAPDAPRTTPADLA